MVKCVFMEINKRKHDPSPILQLGNSVLQSVPCAKYLGDILQSNGSHNELVNDRTNKGNAITISATSISNELSLGVHHTSISLLIHDTILIPTILFNSQSWSNLTTSNLDKLSTIQTTYLKRMMKAPKSTPNAFLFLELGITPIKYQIHQRKLLFLRHLEDLPADDPTSKAYNQQKLYPYAKNWYNETMKLLETYLLIESWNTKKPKHKWANDVKKAISSYSYSALTQECKLKTKISNLEFTAYATQPYITKCPFHISSMLFKFRSKTINCKDNQHSSHTNLNCRLCNTQIESQDHIINCDHIRNNNEIITLDVRSLTENCDMQLLNIIYKRYQDFLNKIQSNQTNNTQTQC